MKLTLALFFAGFAAASVLDPKMLLGRQTDCSVYGDYEPYLGPCGDDACGDSGAACRPGRTCVPYPSKSSQCGTFVRTALVAGETT